MPNFSQKLKSLTLGATLSLALAFLIIHPGMIVTTEAQSFEGIYLPEPIDSIGSDLEGEDYGLDPIYVGRPLYYEGDRMNVAAAAACGGICGLIVSSILVTFGIEVGWLTVQRIKATLWFKWLGLYSQHPDYSTRKQKFEQWAETHKLVDVVGKKIVKIVKDRHDMPNASPTSGHT